MDLSALIGPAVVAAFVSGIVTTIGFWINRSTTIATHREKLLADSALAERKFAVDSELAERKVNADIALAEKKVALDASFADRKRRQELAEEVLSEFYQMVDTIRAIRSPFSSVDEGKDRPKWDGETPGVEKMRDTYYVIVKRFESRRKEMADLLSRRYRMTAWFGKEAAEPFEIVQNALGKIVISARSLIDWAGQPQPTDPDNIKLKNEMIGDIWQGAAKPDVIGQEIDRATALIEAICRPILQEQVK